MDTTKGFKEVVLIKEAHAAWLASPEVSRRAEQLRGIAEHEGLEFTAEGMTRMFQISVALDQTAGHLPSAHSFMPGGENA